MKNNLTSGSVPASIAGFALPYLFACLLQVLYGLADLYIIGQFCGVDATTSVSIGSQIMHMLTVIITGLAMGSTVLIGRTTGANDIALRNKAIGNTITGFAVFSLALTFILLMSAHKTVELMSTPAESVSGTYIYLVICFIGIPFITGYNIISSIFRGMGDSKSPMYFVIIAFFFNVILDFIFIGGLNLGPAGAALGTTMAQTASVVVAVLYIRKKNIIPELSKRDFVPEKAVIATILRTGVPVSLQDGLIQVSFLAITVFANMRGLNDAAAVGIVEKIIGILFLVNSSMLATVSSLAAQNIGAGKKDRAKKILFCCIGICVIFGLIISISMQFLAEESVGLFSNSPEVIVLGGQYMKGYVWDTIIAGIHFCFSGYFCSCEHSGISFAHNAASMALVRIPMAYWTSKAFASLYPMGFSAPLGSFLSIIICVIAFIWLNRKDNVI